jgi:hypothetical protein
MRVTITLSALLIAAAVVSGQASPEPTSEFTPEPTTRPVYPVCDLAFSVAAQRVRASLVATLANPAATDGDLEPTPSASPAARGASTFLDDAVRRCAGVEEFVAASALYPEVLRDTDPISFLMERCEDPLQGLDQYATCASLVRALATPSPSPTPSPTPTATPEPQATARPDKTGSRAKKRSKQKSDWTRAAAQTLQAYNDSAYGAYVYKLYRPINRLRNMDCASVSDQRCLVLQEDGKAIVRKARSAVMKHLAFMRTHSPARCFKDAYAQDRAVANKLLSSLDEWRARPPATMRARSQRIGAAHAATLDHVKNVTRYTRDCH